MSIISTPSNRHTYACAHPHTLNIETLKITRLNFKYVRDFCYLKCTVTLIVVHFLEETVMIFFFLTDEEGNTLIMIQYDHFVQKDSKMQEIPQ